MFGLLSSSSQIYGLQQAEEHNNSNSTTSQSTANLNVTSRIKLNNYIYSKHRRTKSSVSDSFRETNRFFSSIGAMQQSIKAPSTFIEKFMKSELVNTSYDTIKYFKNTGEANSEVSKTVFSSNHRSNQHRHSNPDGILNNFNCLHGSYRNNCDGEFYDANFKTPSFDKEMTIKCSKNLLTETPHPTASVSLRKFLDFETIDVLPNEVVASGASSGEFNSSNSDGNHSSLTSGSTSLHKRLSFGRVGGGTKRNRQNSIGDQTQLNNASDNLSPSMAATSMSSDFQRTSPTCSSEDRNISTLDHKKIPTTDRNMPRNVHTGVPKLLSPESIKHRKLMQMISNYDQQNKLLQREFAKEKRRRTEELAYVVKSLLCFESKLKTDMKIVNQRMQEKDIEICRLVMQNRALRNKLTNLKKKVYEENQRDKGVGEDELVQDLCKMKRNDSSQVEGNENNEDDYDNEDCKVSEALQCINCRKMFYELKESWTETKKDKTTNDDPTTEHGSSSDDTVSSSFYGARRSVRYTSKRTSGTFREYMHSRSMNIDDPSLENNSEENDSTISREDSQTSYEKMNLVYSRLMQRMHDGNCDSERDYRQSAGAARSCSRLSNKSSVSSKASSEKSSPQIDEDDGIFSPTQEDDYENDEHNVSNDRELNIVQRKSKEFSETTPKQVYEASTDDWYDSASDQEEITSSTPSASKSYGHGAINPVLECVNQILLQQSMEEPTQMDIPTNSINENNIHNKYANKKTYNNNDFQNLPQRSSLSGRHDGSLNCIHSNEGHQISSRTAIMTRKRVHFSTKNSMVHVPRNDEHDVEDDADKNCSNDDLSNNNMDNTKLIPSHYHPMNYYQTQVATGTSKGLVEVAADILNYESIYSNEYEPIIGSEHNGSNFYVDMESTTKMSSGHDSKISKMPPALPPKPANLLKFKSLQQVDEMANEHNQDAVSNTTAQSEPDYCSIAEVNMNITSVQIVADVHHKAESEADVDDASQSLDTFSEIDVEVSTVVSDDTCAGSHKTDEIEEIFADIPKLPNVAAIIAPKYNSTQQLQTMNSDYLVMSPKVETSIAKTQNAHKLNMNNATPLKLHIHLTQPLSAQQHKRKHVPNILAEINKRKSLPNSPTTPTAPLNSCKSPKAKALFRNMEESTTPNTNLPLQAEFDWYNLDAEYGKAPLNPPDLLKVNDNVSGVCSSINVLAEISEDHESIVTTADEYNLDEEFSLASEKSIDLMSDEKMEVAEDGKNISKLEMKSDICEAVNFPLLSESSPTVRGPAVANTKKIKNNLANFEKFIEGSGLSTKPLPNKRKIYFAGPFV